MAARIPGNTAYNPFLEPVPILPTSYSTCLSTSFTQPQIAPHFVAQAPIPPLITYQIPTFPTSSSFGIGSNSTGGWTNKETTRGNERVWDSVGGAYQIETMYPNDQMDESSIRSKNKGVAAAESKECPVTSMGELVPVKLEDGCPTIEFARTLYKDEKYNCTEKKEWKRYADKTSNASLQPEGDLDLENNLLHKDLPEELLTQFSARRCELCVVQMNSALQSRMHYNGKQHQKKVRLFMNNWYKEHGEPNSKKMRKDFSIGLPKIPDDKRLYCECCDLSFTSMLHAQQHYMGRNHQRVVSGQQPLRSGYFNKMTHRWQRFPPWNELTRFGFDTILSPELCNQEVVLPEKTLEKQEDQESRKGRFFCDLCNIGATSQEQLDMHFKGGKHKKAEKMAAQTEGFSDDLDIDCNSSQDVLQKNNMPWISRGKVYFIGYAIGKTQIGKLLKDQEEILKIWQENGNQLAEKKEPKKRKAKKLKTEASKIDSIVFQWFCAARNKNLPISGPIIQEKALEVVNEVQLGNNCKASNGCLEEFKVRHNITWKTVSGESADVCEASVRMARQIEEIFQWL